MQLFALIAGSGLGGFGLGMASAVVHVSLTFVGVPYFAPASGVTFLVIVALLFPELERWLPERSCQVPREWINLGSRSRTAFRWGKRLGLGFCTYVVTPALYAVAVAAAIQPRLSGALIVGSTYGVTRGSVIAMAAVGKGQRERVGRAEVLPRGKLKRALQVPTIVATLALLAVTMFGPSVRSG